MTDADKELERLAKAATPGPWEYKPGFADWNMPMLHSIEARGLAILEIEGRMPSPIGGSPKEHQRFADAAYVAAANPQAVLALIERLRGLEAERKGGAWLSLDQLLLLQRICQAAQCVREDCEVEDGIEIDRLCDALDEMGEVCVTDEGWLAVKIKEAKGDE